MHVLLSASTPIRVISCVRACGQADNWCDPNETQVSETILKRQQGSASKHGYGIADRGSGSRHYQILYALACFRAFYFTMSGLGGRHPFQEKGESECVRVMSSTKNESVEGLRFREGRRTHRCLLGWGPKHVSQTGKCERDTPEGAVHRSIKENQR